MLVPRFGMTIRRRPGSEEAYRRYHAVGAEVLDKILECNIKNYSTPCVNALCPQPSSEGISG
jgi:L-rhamnose mutarotase